MGDDRTGEVLTRTQFLERFGGRRAAEAQVRRGSWRRVLRGTYAPSSLELTLDVRCRAAHLLLPDHARVADRCLLWLLGVDVLPPGPPALEVVVPRGAVVPSRNGVRARVADLPARDCQQLSNGLPCLRPVRAAIDLMRQLPFPEAVVVADAVQHARLGDLEELLLEVERHAGLRGVRQARRSLELSSSRAESPPETRVRLVLVLAGLDPVPQHRVVDRDGRFLARVDLAFPSARVAIEYDGRTVHERPDVFTRDRQRQNALVAAGWIVLRFTADDLRRPGAVVAQVRAVLAARAAA